MFRFASINLPFVLSVSWSLSASSFNVKFCAGVTSPRTSFVISLVTATFVVYVDKFASASTSGYIARASQLQGHLRLPHSMHVQFTLTSSPIALLFHDALSPWPNPLSTVHLWTGFITGRQGGHTTTCFAVCVWEERQVCSDQVPNKLERSGIVGYNWCTAVTCVMFVHRTSNEA